MMGPNNSGRMRRQHHHRPAGLAVSDHAGLAVGFGMQGDDFFEEHRFGAGDVSDGLARHGVGQEADEIAGVPGFQRDADLAVGLEPADARAVTGAGVDDDEGPPRRIDLDARRRNHPREAIIDRPFEPAAVDDQLHLVVEHMRSGLGHVLAILVAALADHVRE